MKVLLVNPLFDPDDPDAVPPLGIAALASFMQTKGHEVRILDLNLQNRIGASVESSVSKSLMYEADVVGLTCWGNLTPFIIEFCRLFKSRRPETKLVIGGEYASFRAESILKESKGDFIVRGEGEETFSHLLHVFEGKENVGQVKGITYKEPDGILHLSDRRPLMNMDDLPFVKWDLFDDLEQYRGYRDFRRLPFQASRGCPFKCIFCSVQRTWGEIQRKKSPKRIIDEIKYYINEFGLEQLCIYDDTFTLDKNWITEICSLMLKEKISIKWNILTRVDLVGKDLLKTMKNAGCVGIFFGVESVSPQVQELIGKVYTEEFIKKKVAETVAEGMLAQVSVIFGWPVDTPRTVDRLSRFCQKMARVGVGIHQHMLFPLPGTKLTEEYSSSIIPNPYPKMTQPSLAKLPPEYYSILERHKEYVPDFWMFKSEDIDPQELSRIFAETKISIVEENIHRAAKVTTYQRLGLI